MSFESFPKLPPELRQRIWHFSLFDERRVALAPYKPGCWQIQKSATDDTDELVFKFEGLDLIPMEVPLFWIDRESRSVAMRWIRKNNVKLKTNQSSIGPPIMFFRQFDAHRDALYIDEDNIADFLEPRNITDVIDLATIETAAAEIKQLALSSKFFREGVPEELVDILEVPLCEPDLIWIVVGQKPCSSSSWALDWGINFTQPKVKKDVKRLKRICKDLYMEPLEETRDLDSICNGFAVVTEHELDNMLLGRVPRNFECFVQSASPL